MNDKTLRIREGHRRFRMNNNNTKKGGETFLEHLGVNGVHNMKKYQQFIGFHIDNCGPVQSG